MNFADIEHAWRSPHNRPTPAELEQQKMKFTADLRRRHRGFYFFILPVFAALIFFTGKIVFHVLWPDPAHDRVDFSREWGVLPVAALPWAAALLFAWQYRRHRAQHENYERSIAASARALLDENRLSRTRLKIVGLMHALFLAVIPIVVYQLRAVEKAGDEILLPAFVLWPLIAIGIGATLIYHYRRKLQPEQRELEALLKSYE
jgi:hypothetical protein